MTDMSTTKDRSILLDVKGLKTYFFQRRGVLKAVDGVNFTVRAVSYTHLTLPTTPYV